MKPIKFRFFCKGKMYYPNLIGTMTNYDENPAVYIEVPEMDHVPHYKDGELMQFTGIGDKDGEDIYDGDIVEAYKHGDEKQRFELLVSNNFCYMFGNWTIIEFLNIFRTVKVIGNVWENPELLAGDRL